jgi:hypothetical protein
VQEESEKPAERIPFFDEYTYLSSILGIEKVDDYWLKERI